MKVYFEHKGETREFVFITNLNELLRKIEKALNYAEETLTGADLRKLPEDPMKADLDLTDQDLEEGIRLKLKPLKMKVLDLL